MEVGVVDAIERLVEAIDACAAEDLHGLFAPHLLARVGGLIGAMNRLAAELTRSVREADSMGAAEDDGLTTMASWLRGHARYSPAAAAQLVASGRAVEHLPKVAASAAAGAITPAQVAVIAGAAGPAQLAQAAEKDVDLSVVDEALVTVATTQSFQRLVEVVKHYREALDPDGTEPDPTEGRGMALTRRSHGGWSVRGDLDDIGGEKLAAALESVLQANRPTGDMRNRSQQLADALVQLADNALASGDLPVLRTVTPHLVVTVPLADLMATSPANGATPGFGAASTGFGQVLPAARARWLACDAQLTRIVLDPAGLPLDVSRQQRVVPPHIRKAVELRDQTCVFAGCDAPHWWCDVHHLLHWIDGGPTSVDNSGLLCERHHTKVHHGYQITRDPDGTWHTHRPDGTEIVVLPHLADDPLLAA